MRFLADVLRTRFSERLVLRGSGVLTAVAIAAISSIGYSGFMIGPPLIGDTAQHASLTAVLGVVVVTATILALTALNVSEKQPNATAGQPSLA